MSTRSLAFLFGLVVLASGVEAQRVWVVAPAPGPGVAFTAIQPAVDAAADGDTVLVRRGIYGDFTIDGKAVSVAADGEGVQVRSVTVANTGPTQPVVLRRLTSRAFTDALTIDACLGAIQIEDCTLTPLGPTTASSNTSPGARVTDSPQVTFAGCLLIGAGPQGMPNRSASEGLVVLRSSVTLHGCTVMGGPGESSMLMRVVGGPGVVLSQAFVAADDTAILGGNGGVAFSVLLTCVQVGTAGGDALVFTSARDRLYAFGGSITAGQGGNFSSCPPVPDGARVVGPGTLTEVPGVVPTLMASSPVRAGQSLSLQITGPVGAGAAVLASSIHAPLFVAACRGTLDPSLATGTTLGLGVVPPSGQLALSVSLPTPLGVQAVTLYVQTVMAQGGSCLLGRSTALLVLETGL